MPSPRVAFVILDAFPFRGVDEKQTPSLARLREQGGWAREGGRAELSASTYPNHATFVTGAAPIDHGVLTSMVLVDGGFQSAQEVGPRGPTLFTRCREAGRRSVAVFGDQNLVGVCGAQQADAHWPPGGVLPEDAPRGGLGYGADEAVLSGLEQVDVDSADLLVVQLDEVDTARHLFGPGPGVPEVAQQCRRTDAALGQVIERLAPRWDDTILIAVSDHDHESVRPGAIDLAAEARASGLDVLVQHDGTAALVVGDVEASELLELPGVSGETAIAPGVYVVWGDEGQQFGIDWGLKAQHGSPRTAGQLAVVGGGHPRVAELARWVEAGPPPAAAWADRVADLLDLPDRRG